MTSPGAAAQTLDAAPTRGRLVLERATVKSYAVLAEAVSVKLSVPSTPEGAAELLRRIADLTRGRASVPVEIGGLATVASVEAVNATSAGTGILLHTPRDFRVVRALFQLAGRPARVAVGVPEALSSLGGAAGVAPLAALLDAAAAALGVPAADLLERVTTFRDRDGRLVPGRRALAELSEAQRPVVADRLCRLLARRRER